MFLSSQYIHASFRLSKFLEKGRKKKKKFEKPVTVPLFPKGSTATHLLQRTKDLTLPAFCWGIAEVMQWASRSSGFRDARQCLLILRALLAIWVTYTAQDLTGCEREADGTSMWPSCTAIIILLSPHSAVTSGGSFSLRLILVVEGSDLQLHEHSTYCDQAKTVVGFYCNQHYCKETSV